MRHLTATISLTVAVFFGSSGVSWSANFQKGLTAYNSGDYADALREWEPLAEQGNAPTQFNLGLMYDDGKGVPQDHKTAVKWYRLSAEQGYANAQYNLGFMYNKGNGVPQDYETAAKWYRLAAEQGNANAQNNLGVMYDKGNHVPLVLFRTSHPDWTGTWQDYKIAVKWFRLAAEQGNANAQNNLGGMHDKRRGVRQDYETAAKWYTLAADQGHAIAQSNLEILQKKTNPWWKIW
jgi:TPR repeat protein